jgi:hypothetical protein
VYINSDYDNFVEVGWYEEGTFSSIAKCDDVVAPHVLVYAVVNGFIKCKPSTPQLSAGQNYSFRVDNPDHDHDFTYYWDTDGSPDQLLGNYATDFSKGYPESGDERKNADDSLRADMSSMAVLGGGRGWNDFPSPVSLDQVGNVGGYSVCSWGDSFLEVRANC